MATVIDILESLESDNSRIFKEDLLEKHRNNELLQRVFVAAFDPYTNYFVNKFKMPSFVDPSMMDDDAAIGKFLNFVIDSLSTREITGNSAKNAVVSFFTTLSENQQKWCLRILLKNLRCGVQETTVNKIWPGLITKFSVQLAETLDSHFEKDKGIVIDDVIKYPVRVEPKLDGLRCVVVKRHGKVTMFTRNGTLLETLPTIKSAIENASWDNFALDGEAMGSDWNESASVIMSRKNGKNDSGIIFHIFDAMHFDEWSSQSSKFSLKDRVDLVKELIEEMPADSPVRQVPGIIVANEKELLEFYSNSMENGYEGIMVKNLDSFYLFKRSSSVMKLKPVTTYEGVVVGSYEGRRGSKREGMWGGFEIVFPNGVVTRVGGGFTDKLKAEIGLNPSAWIGKIVEVEGQPDPLTKDGLTKDGRVRFPVFSRVRDQNDVDDLVLIAGRKHLKLI